MPGEGAVRAGIDEDDAVAGNTWRSAATAAAEWMGALARLKFSTS